MCIKKTEIAVGLFLATAIMSLLVLALRVSGLTTVFKEEQGYSVKAVFQNIGGLKVRAKVSIAGVPVGRVVSIALDPETFDATVSMVINPACVKKIPEDSTASILTAGLLGDSYIGLTPGNSETGFLREGSLIPVTSTDSAVILERLVSRFLASKGASNPAP